MLEQLDQEGEIVSLAIYMWWFFSDVATLVSDCAPGVSSDRGGCSERLHLWHSGHIELSRRAKWRGGETLFQLANSLIPVVLYSI